MAGGNKTPGWLIYILPCSSEREQRPKELIRILFQIMSGHEFFLLLLNPEGLELHAREERKVVNKGKYVSQWRPIIKCPTKEHQHSANVNVVRRVGEEEKKRFIWEKKEEAEHQKSRPCTFTTIYSEIQHWNVHIIVSLFSHSQKVNIRELYSIENQIIILCPKE